MKKNLLLPFLLLSMLAAGTLSSAPVAKPAAKECKDCGCSGPAKGGSCPDEKDKTCQCGKK